MIKAFWHVSSNYGDKLTPYILDQLNVEYQYVDKLIEEDHYIMCGSIFTACNKHSIIWGAGIAQPYNFMPPKEILAVRGKDTRDFVLGYGVDCPEIYGDPAMILPLLYSPKKDKKRKLGIMPHPIDKHLYLKDSWDMNEEVEKTIDYILESEMIISSSFHAVVTAWAYGVPFQWIRSKGVIGSDFKFYDFLNTDYDLEKFIDVFPFKEQLKLFAK